MADKRKALLLRIAPELWEELNRWASAELRSVNAQIEYVLREAVRKRSAPRGGPELPEVHPWLRRLVDDLREIGLTEWVQRVEAAMSFVGAPEETLGRVRSTLTELVAAESSLPPETASVARGVLRVLGDASRPPENAGGA